MKVLLILAVALLCACQTETADPECTYSVQFTRSRYATVEGYSYYWEVTLPDTPAGPLYYNGQRVREPWCNPYGYWRVTPRVDSTASTHIFSYLGCEIIK